MASPLRFVTLDKNLQTEIVTANNAGTAVAVPPRKIIGISIDAKSFVLFSQAGTDAAATDTLLPAAGIYYFDTGNYLYVSLFAHSGSNAITSVFECNN